MSDDYITVAALNDIELNSNKAFDVGGRSILISHTTSGVYAVENICSHQCAPLEGGKVKAHFLFCPLHGARFDMRDGTTKGKLTDKSITRFDVRVTDNLIAVKL